MYRRESENDKKNKKRVTVEKEGKHKKTTFAMVLKTCHTLESSKSFQKNSHIQATAQTS